MSTSQTLIKSGQSLDDFLSTFWTSHLHQIEDEVTDFKKHELPLARIKKVMKSDPGVYQPPIIYPLTIQLRR